jgi:DNA-binding NarL/FixJ family response regulator
LVLPRFTGYVCDAPPQWSGNSPREVWLCVYPIKLLLIESNVPLARQVKQVLQREPGLELIGAARSARAALTLLGEVKTDVVILDLNLADMGGLEAVPVILERAPSISVILMVDHDDPRYERAAASKGACTCIRKSLIATDLVPAVKRVRERKEGR